MILGMPARHPLVTPDRVASQEWLNWFNQVAAMDRRLSALETGGVSGGSASDDETETPTTSGSSGSSGSSSGSGSSSTMTGPITYAQLPMGAGVWMASPTISGAVAVGDTLTVAGAASFGSTLAVAGAASLSGTLGVAGVATFADDVDPAQNYVSNLGAIDRRYLSVHAAELWVQTLVAQSVMATIGGRVFVAPTTTLSEDLAAAATSMVVTHNHLASGDIVVLEAHNRVEWIAVTSAPSGTGPYTYSITRDLDGSGANDWIAGDAVVSTGTTGDGFMDLYATSGVLTGFGPTIVGNVRTGTSYNQIEARWAIGNLNGLYGYAADTYGAAFGTPSGAWIKIDPTNGVRIGHNTTTRISLDASTGAASFTGGITSASGSIGGWTIGASSLTAGSGATSVGLDSGGTNPAIYAGSSTPGSAPFRVTSAGALTASNATITGHITATSGDVTGAIAAGSITADKLLIGKSGGALNPDPGFADLTAWVAFSASSQLPTRQTVTDGPVGVYVYRSATGAGDGGIISRATTTSDRIPIDRTKAYRVSVWARRSASPAANGTLWVGVADYDISGSQLGFDGVIFTASPSATWTYYEGQFGAGTSFPFDSTARSVSAEALLNWAGTAGYVEIQDLRIEEVISGTLIEGNSISTGHIQANAITADKITAGAVTTDKIDAGAVTAGKINVTSLSAISANLGTVNISTGGFLASGASAFGTGTGYWLDYNSGNPRMRVGNPAGSRMEWDGSGLAVYGSGYELTDSGGLLFQGGSGSDDSRSIRWSDGSRIIGRTDVSALHLAGPGGGTWSQINMYSDMLMLWGGTGSGGKSIYLDQSVLAPDHVELDLGSDADPWFNIVFDGDLRWWDPPTTVEPDWPLVWSPSTKNVYVRDNGFTGEVFGPTYINVIGGLVVACS